MATSSPYPDLGLRPDSEVPSLVSPFRPPHRSAPCSPPASSPHRFLHVPLVVWPLPRGGRALLAGRDPPARPAPAIGSSLAFRPPRGWAGSGVRKGEGNKIGIAQVPGSGGRCGGEFVVCLPLFGKLCK